MCGDSCCRESGAERELALLQKRFEELQSENRRLEARFSASQAECDELRVAAAQGRLAAQERVEAVLKQLKEEKQKLEEGRLEMSRTESEYQQRVAELEAEVGGLQEVVLRECSERQLLVNRVRALEQK